MASSGLKDTTLLALQRTIREREALARELAEGLRAHRFDYYGKCIGCGQPDVDVRHRGSCWIEVLLAKAKEAGLLAPSGEKET